jgi:pyruvate kinase
MIQKKTKIVCTLGPSTATLDILREMYDAGMDVVRLNFSHGTHEEQLERVHMIRQLNEEVPFPVAILLDTKGPEIRTHSFQGGAVTITKGSTVTITMNERVGDETGFSVNYPNLVKDVKIGTPILVDDGYLSLIVKAIDVDQGLITTLAQNTHVCKSRRGVNVPEIDLTLDFISDKDLADIEFACDNDLDFIAASFTRTKEDVLAIKEILQRKGKEHIQVIAKIENRTGLKHLDEILDVAEGVMVARGDLGVELNVEQVPLIQRQMIEKAHIRRKIVITATQMLESMIENVTPTRAEVSDIANAVLDGTDAIMLSGETAIGKHPVKVVQMMAKVASTIEPSMNLEKMIKRVGQKPITNNNARAIGNAVAYSSKDLPVAAIISVSNTGYTARLMSQYRLRVPIFALVRSKAIARSVALNYGVYAKVQDVAFDQFERAVAQGIEHVMKYKHVLKPLGGDRVIVTAGLPLGQTSSQTNTMQIIKFKDKEEWLREWNS